jgi:Flp pilus assembly protein CpaB
MVSVQNLLSTRMGTVVVGAVAALLAGVVLLVYVGQYRDSVRKEQKPVAVLVANGFIPQGTTGDIVGGQQMYTINEIPANRVENGAITDPNSLKGKVAVADLFPGKQLTESDFATSDASDVVIGLKLYDRAIAIPLDAAHGMIGYVQKGDHVDIIAGFNVETDSGKQIPITKTIMQDILVLDAPDSSRKGGLGSGNTNANVVLLMDDQQAADMAFSSDNGKVWLVLRATTGGNQHAPKPVTLETLLFDVSPIAINNAFRRSAKAGVN